MNTIITLIKSLIKPILHHTAVLFPHHSSLSPAHAREILESTSPCPTGTCVAENTLREEYDLQIIVPAYNVEKYIRECLESVVSQVATYRTLVTVIDDGSTDGTGRILDDFVKEYTANHLSGGGNEPTFELIHQENRGFSGARNRGLSVIRGRYVMLLDSDDVLPAGTIQAMLDEAEQTEADIVQGSWTVFTEDPAHPVDEHILSQEGLLTDIRGVLTGYTCMKLYRATILEHFQFPEGFWFEDTPVSFLLFAMPYRFAATKALVYGYRLNPTGITATASRRAKALDSHWITERCLEEFPAFGLSYDQRAYEYFLRQTITNWRRAKHQPKAVREAMFVRAAWLMEKYFEDFQTEVPRMRGIEAALRRKQFRRFEMLAV